MVVDADLARLAEVRDFVRAAAHEYGASEETIADLVQAVDEAATNAIVHGYQGAPGSLDVMAMAIGHDVVVVLADRARLFDPTSVPARDLGVEPRDWRPGGMGIHLIRAATDSQTHRPRPGGGNILTLARTLGRGIGRRTR